MKFAVVDLETTGGLAKRERITEVGIAILENGKIVDTFQSLVNPERSIPPQITRITGITTDMVSTAPKFYEIAKEVVLKTQDCIFVAHNVRFDYSFLQEEFRRLGYTYSRRKLCTVALSKRIYPHLRSHGLSHLVETFQLPMKDRHRAMDDARATAHLLQQIISDFGEDDIRHLVNYGITHTHLPHEITMDDLHDLPENPGVYFFEDENGRYIYIGKSINIKKRVIQHFRATSKKSQRLLQSVHKISYEQTIGELIALIKEDQYIKKYQPPINKAQRKSSFPYAIIKEFGAGHLPLYRIIKQKRNSNTKGQNIAEFATEKSAYQRINSLCESLDICKCALLQQSPHNCWKRQIHQCVGEVKQEEKLVQFDQLLSQYFDQDCIIVEKEKAVDEGQAFILIQDGCCTGYGVVPSDQAIQSIDQVRDHLQPLEGTAYTNRIIFRTIQQKRKWDIIPL